jgi:hypothetical protein
MTKVRYKDDWAFISPNFAIYPREDGTFSVGKSSGARDYCDVETGFANQQAAVDHALWMTAPNAPAMLPNHVQSGIDALDQLHATLENLVLQRCDDDGFLADVYNQIGVIIATLKGEVDPL